MAVAAADGKQTQLAEQLESLRNQKRHRGDGTAVQMASQYHRKLCLAPLRHCVSAWEVRGCV